MSFEKSITTIQNDTLFENAIVLLGVEIYNRYFRTRLL